MHNERPNQRIELGTEDLQNAGKTNPTRASGAIPFARFTVEWQSQLERQKKVLDLSQQIMSPFALLNTEEGEEELGGAEVHENDERYLGFQAARGETT